MEPPLVQIGAARSRLPEWARKSRTHFDSLHRLKADFRGLNLHTVCESARCPNIHECFHRGAATFLILGNYCTRGCGFCSVPKGNPRARDMRLDPEEPAKVARMAAAMKLRYIVITSVNRDDLSDGGSAHFAAAVRAVREALPDARVEVLTPDFAGDLESVARVLAASPHVFNHNVETVARLYPRVRPQADYRRSLDVLAFAAVGQTPWSAAVPLAGLRPKADEGVGRRPGGLPHHNPRANGPCSTARPLTKSGLMVGLGETEDEVRELLHDLRAAGVDIVTIGQYLQPTRRNLPVAAYIEPRLFEAYREYGISLGFKAVFSGPLVRSSYMAEALSEEVGRSC